MMIKSFILPYGLALIMGSGVYAQTSSSPKKDTSIYDKIEVRTKKKNLLNRPKAPSRQSIECCYADEIIYVSFFIPEGECTMTVTDNETGVSLQYVFPTIEPAEIYVGSLTDAYIEFDTESGHSYEGWLGK